VDTTHLTLEQQVEQIVRLAQQRERSQKSKKDS
jgi:hypothetical protein